MLGRDKLKPFGMEQLFAISDIVKRVIRYEDGLLKLFLNLKNKL